MFKWRHFYILSTNELISNLMPAQNSWHGGNKRAEKARHFAKIQLGEHLATN